MTDSRISGLAAVPAIGSIKTWSGVREAAVGDDGRMAADMANQIFSLLVIEAKCPCYLLQTV